MKMSLLIGVLLVASACSPAGNEPPGSTTSSSEPATTTTVTSDDTCRTGNLVFTDSGLAGAVGEDVGDATTITQIRWDDAPTCERLTFLLASDSGAPAGTLGPTAVFVDPATGLVRIELPAEMQTTATADMLVEGDLVERLFVVRSAEGHMTVDLHSPPTTSLAARAFVTDSPATLVVDVIAGPEEVTPPGPALSETAVVVTPAPGPTAYPFTVEGYAAPGLTRVSVQVRQEDRPISDRTLSLPTWSDTWQAIEVAVGDGPPGVIDVFMGTATPEGDPDIGATVRLDLP